MKNILNLVIIVLIFSACGASVSEESLQDLAGLKSAIKEKEQRVNLLKQEIDSLRESIRIIDPDFMKKELAMVELIGIERETFNHYVEVQGAITADIELLVSSEIPGKITSLMVKEGDFVKRGQLVATVDTESAEKQIEELKKSMELADEVYKRQKSLWDKNIGSELQFLQAKNNKERLEKSLSSAELAIKKSKVHAPISGAVTLVLAKKGEFAGPGIPIFQMINIQKVKIKADVPELYVRDIKINDFVDVEVPVLDYKKKVKVSRIGNVINPNNRTFEVEVKLSNANHELKPNLMALLFVNDYSAKDAVVIPLELIQQDVSGKDYVYVAKLIDSKYYVEKKIIQLGKSYDSRMEILSGLEGNEQLISIGAQYLAEGEEILVNSI